MTEQLGDRTWDRTDHLADLLATTDRLVDDVAGAVRLGATAPVLWDRAVIASCRLDGARMVATPPEGDTTTLVDDDADLEDVWRREYAGVRRALAADDLAERLRDDVLGGIRALHHLLTQGLVARSASGRLRRVEQAVHTGGDGRVVFRPVRPADLAGQVARLPLVMAGRDHHPVEVAGVLQFELLRLHPFESANGRLARSAARLVLRDRGRDPGGLAVPEITMATRPAGNYDDVAAALRRGDLTGFLEGWAEDLTAGLRLARATLGLEPEPVDLDLVAGLPTAFTLVDVATARGDRTDLVGARRTVNLLLDAGLAERLHGSRGLRLRRRPGPVALPPAPTS
ncbi:Fic family protein [Salsipaludibacter albus]|uniref:Fic family protein n=1 Tax=Salsipaludibacter albus TaxID=2849650 RepID=UPI003083FAC9|nr:Fic family protein [Salsipaludibacter albus]